MQGKKLAISTVAFGLSLGAMSLTGCGGSSGQTKEAADKKCGGAAEGAEHKCGAEGKCGGEAKAGAEHKCGAEGKCGGEAEAGAEKKCGG